MSILNGTQFIYAIRIVLASICGCFIGLERKNRSKKAGVRTHCVVACASALMMIISKYGFTDLSTKADGARIAAQVVSGIGFLGAGMIIVHKNTISGLTTAAGVWATSGVGLAIGAGMYVVGIFSSVLIILAQIVLHRNFGWFKMLKTKKLIVQDVNQPDYQKHMTHFFEEKGIVVCDVSIEKNGENSTYVFTLEIPHSVMAEEVVSEIDFRCSIGTIV